MFAAIFVLRAHNAGCAHGSAPVGAALDESGFEPVGAEERFYGSAA